MRKMRSQAPAPVGAVMSEDSASKCASEGLRALKQDLGAQQAASSNHQGESDLKSNLRPLVQSRKVSLIQINCIHSCNWHYQSKSADLKERSACKCAHC